MYNMIACISSNPRKLTHTVYTISEYNGLAAAFVSFCELMVQSWWLVHDKILVMDNTGIHTGASRQT
jgi:hypothetical protein